MSARRVLGSMALGLVLCSCGAAQQPEVTTFNMPSELSEISGLAVAGPDSVFTHEDEHAIVYELRLRDGKIMRVFALGDPTIEGDFEGIATAQDRVFLVTSDGLIYSARPGKNRERVDYHVYDSGIGPRCEIEGLAQSPEPGGLLVLCKRFRNGEKDNRLEIYLWRIGAEHAEDKPWLSLPLKGIMNKDERAQFRPSALEWDPAKQRLIVVSARNRMMLTLSPEGRLLARQRLKGSRHHKTEGLAIMPDGRMVLADEGAKNREGRLTVYPPL